MRQLIVLGILLITPLINLFSQASEKNAWEKFKEDYSVKIKVSFQLWNTYTMNQKLFDTESQKYIPISNRFNSQLRRTRMTFAGQPYENFKYKLTASLDLIGKDLLSATQGGANNGGSPIFRIWNAFIDWNVINNSDLLHVVSGYIPPQIGRESITSALKSTSFEKSWSQNYLRRSIVGIGPGRSMGINLGGQSIVNNKISLSYDIGIFSPQTFSFNGNSAGIEHAPLLTGRLALYIGEPESKTYTIEHKVNYFGNRNGLTIAFAGSHQGKNDLFKSNQAIGLDWLLNLKNVNIDGEWTFLNRSGDDSERKFDVISNTGYLRIGYNIFIKGSSYLEPIIMFVKFNGPLDLASQIDAAYVGAFAGTDQILEIGFNYHLNTKLKFSLFYTFNKGEKGDAVDGITFNNYYGQGSVGAIERGNLIGLGIVGMF